MVEGPGKKEKESGNDGRREETVNRKGQEQHLKR